MMSRKIDGWVFLIGPMGLALPGGTAEAPPSLCPQHVNHNTIVDVNIRCRATKSGIIGAPLNNNFKVHRVLFI